MNLEPKIFFDLAGISFADIFGNVKYTWEVLPRVKKYIEKMFDDGLIVGNYKDKKYVFIEEGTVVSPGVEIIGPAIIGKNCFLGHASLFRENCLLADNVHIGHGAEIKNSIFLKNSVAAHLNYVGDSIVGGNVNISGGAMLANFRLDKKPVSVKIGNERIDTGFEKFSSIVGDNSFIGVNAVLNPGTVLSKNCIVYPLTSVSGFYKEGFQIK